MNTNTRKHMGIVERAKKTFVGKVICRIMGEENGAVMMEYVIVAVLIAAAVAAGAWLFGSHILAMFGVAEQGAIGHDDAAVNRVQGVQNAEAGAHAAASQRNKDFPQSQVEQNAAGDIN